MADSDIVTEAVHVWQQGYRITDGQARVIASQWHGGQVSPLYMLASCGALTPGVASDIERELRGVGDAPKAEELQALLAYVTDGLAGTETDYRGPVDGWSQLWG